MYTFLIAIAEIPGYFLAWQLSESPRFGRRLTQVWGLIAAGVSIILVAVANVVLEPGHAATCSLVLSFCGKMWASAVFQVAYVYPAELFRTSIRASVFGIANVFGRLGAMAAPQLVHFPVLSMYTCLGILGVGMGVLSLQLPETRGQRQQD